MKLNDWGIYSFEQLFKLNGVICKLKYTFKRFALRSPIPTLTLAHPHPHTGVVFENLLIQQGIFVFVFVSPLSIASQNLTLRLSPQISGKEISGLVEVFDGISKWGYICGLQWNFEEADTVCRQLGYSLALRAFTGTEEHADYEYYIINVNCGLSSKKSLEECSYTSWTNQYRFCGDSVSAAGVQCFSKSLFI